MDETEIPAPDGVAQTHGSEASQVITPPHDASPDRQAEGGERSRTVPYGALAEERARRKELQRELQEAATARGRLQDRLDALHAIAAQTGRPSHPAATDGSDAGTPAVEDAGAGPVMTPEVDGAFRTQVLQSVRSYAAERPDFMDAYVHARQARVAELTSLGYGPEEALAITFDNEREIINNAFAAGRNPAQVIYDFAIRRGYRPAGEAQLSAAPSQIPLAKPAGRARPMSEAEKIALAARGQSASKSLSAAGGAATGTLTLEALAGMSDEEFAEATKGDRWQRLLHG
jgi:hypothetical protein